MATNYNNFIFWKYDTVGTELDKMRNPVICNHCGKVYDLHTVKVNHRYQDCDQFTTPCCNYEFADNRTWKSFPDYTKI